MGWESLAVREVEGVGFVVAFFFDVELDCNERECRRGCQDTKRKLEKYEGSYERVWATESQVFKEIALIETIYSFPAKVNKGNTSEIHACIIIPMKRAKKDLSNMMLNLRAEDFEATNCSGNTKGSIYSVHLLDTCGPFTPKIHGNVHLKL